MMDMQTLQFERASLITICTLLTIFYAREHRESPGMRWFVLSNAGYFLGGLMVILANSSPLFLILIVANIFYSTGYLFLHRALTAFFPRRPLFLYLQWALVATSFFQYIYSSAIVPSLTARLVGSATTTGLQYAVCVLAVYAAALRPLHGAFRWMANILTTASAINLLRAVATLRWSPGNIFLAPGLVQPLFVMSNTIIYVVIDIVFLWMIATSLRDKLHHQAITDPLTGLLNRRELEAAAARALAQSRARSLPLSAIVVDLDGFKQINDSLGHGAGDAVIVHAAATLALGLRQHDILSRIGGDEFVIVLPDCTLKRATEIAERLRHQLDGYPVLVGETLVSIRGSFGIASLSASIRSWDELMIEADRALYLAKTSGGNQIHTL